MTDLAIFRKWLYTPHVARWYHDPLDWIHEVEKQDSGFVLDTEKEIYVKPSLALNSRLLSERMRGEERYDTIQMKC